MSGISDKLVQIIKCAIGIVILILILKGIEFLFSLELTISSERIELQYSDVFNLMLILLTFVIIALTVLIAVLTIGAFIGWQSMKRIAEESAATAAGLGYNREKIPPTPENKTSDVEDT